MLLYVDEIQRELDDLFEYATIVREKFVQGRGARELLLDARALRLRAISLTAMMPEKTDTGALLRHTGFMVYWLERGQIDSCKQDILDISESDLPSTQAQIDKWARELVYVDAELRLQVLPLLRTKQFDSAIRKAFVILKTRLCAKFGLDDGVDGDRLVNAIWGAGSTYLPELSESQKQAYRDFFAGLFRLLRNKFAHNNHEPTLSELDMVISGINHCLYVVGDFKSEETWLE